jgi:hypothetical protein
MMDERTCSRCTRTFPATVEFFRKDTGKPLGIAYYCHDCARSYNRARTASQSPEKREKSRLYYLAYIKRVHMACLRAYGGERPSCACCGESEIAFLTLDHIAGDGRKHKDSLSAEAGRRIDGYAFYRWLQDNDYPAGIQVLCWNCNSAKRAYRACPHKVGGGTITRMLVDALKM